MGIKYHITDEDFRPLLLICLDRLAIAYSQNKKNFAEVFKTLPKDMIEELKRLKKCNNEYALEEYSDLAEYAREVMFYDSYICKTPKKSKTQKKYKALTLRSSTTLNMFETFLITMNKLLNVSPGHFVNMFPKCPVEVWDKVEDLREMTIKHNDEHTQYLKCVILCKKLSYTYDAYTGINEDEEEDLLHNLIKD